MLGEETLCEEVLIIRLHYTAAAGATRLDSTLSGIPDTAHQRAQQQAQQLAQQ
jgi:hypothetical protein